MNVAFQGACGAFSETMALKMYPNATTVPCESFACVLDQVKEGTSEYGILPLENSLIGRIGEATQLLIGSGLFICREGSLRIEHCLIGQKGTDMGDLKKVYGHPEALSQCRDFVRACGVDPISWWDGAGAASLVEEDPASAIVGNARIAEITSLEVIKCGIEDLSTNFTRFGSVATSMAERTGNDKTTISFRLAHEPGSLVRALGALEEESISMTRIESMPIRESPWSYAFIVDMLGHAEDRHVRRAIKSLRRLSAGLRILGSYPREVSS